MKTNPDNTYVCPRCKFEDVKIYGQSHKDRDFYYGICRACNHEIEQGDLAKCKKYRFKFNWYYDPGESVYYWQICINDDPILSGENFEHPNDHDYLLDIMKALESRLNDTGENNEA